MLTRILVDEILEEEATEAFRDYLNDDFQAMLDSAWDWLHET